MPASSEPYSSEDDRHLLASIELSEQAVAHGNYPFGALLVDEHGAVVLEAENTVNTACDSTGHAEINLMRAASKNYSLDQLRRCTLYVSAEPCAMCAGAIYWGNVGRVVFGLGVRSVVDVAEGAHEVPTLAVGCREVFDRCSGRVEVSGPHREAEARAVHERFWPLV
jgi:tRNA(Arg) A34 adenosine deaminase TadA